MSVSVWRIGYAGALNLAELGYGSTLGSGRWHNGCAGPLQLVYTGASRALCQLERRVHSNGGTPKDMAMLRLELPETATLATVEDLGLPPDWKQDMASTQFLGMEWLKSSTTLGLWVPSYVQPEERNLLLNPAHPDYAAIHLVVEKNPFLFDPRLFT